MGNHHEHHTHATNKDEIKKMVNYMINHNIEHSEELADIANDLKNIDPNNESFKIIQDALKDYESGNNKLKEAFNLLEKESK